MEEVQDTMGQCLAIHFSDTRKHSILLSTAPLLKYNFEIM